jgi:hypothetical protein
MEIKINFEDLKEIIQNEILTEKYVSIAQKEKFAIMSRLPGEEGKKWRKMKKHWDKESKGETKKLPYKVKNKKKKQAKKDKK